MSQNKTVIPESDLDMPNAAYQGMISSPEFYRPSGSVANSTVISGMNNSFTPSAPPASGSSNNVSTHNESEERNIHLQDRVIVGVMFSISKGLLGEVFPIYLGRNIIGSSNSCDTCLKESTVSAEHAVLFVRCDGYPGECFVTITDYGSTHGTAVNQQDCRYETLKVNNGDVLTIGKHYQLTVNLFEVSKKGLFEDSRFEDINQTSVSDSSYNQSTRDFYSPSQSGNNDNRTVIG